MIPQEEISPQIDYCACRYGTSRVEFRGPKRRLDEGYVAVVGGSEAYGKFVSEPFSDRLEAHLGETVVNLGVMHAGLTLIAEDPAILPIASRARMAIVQVLGAQNMSNRFYTVHPRRNDRFLAASPRLQSMFPDIDFAEVNFTGHLLTCLEQTGRPAYLDVVAELRTAWIARMKAVLNDIRGERILLWMSDRRPEDPTPTTSPLDPVFVDRGMLDALAPHCAGVVEAIATRDAREEGLEGKIYLPGEEQAAAAMPGPVFHDQAAGLLAAAVARPKSLRRASLADAPPHFDPRITASR